MAAMPLSNKNAQFQLCLMTGKPKGYSCILWEKVVGNRVSFSFDDGLHALSSWSNETLARMPMILDRASSIRDRSLKSSRKKTLRDF